LTYRIIFKKKISTNFYPFGPKHFKNKKAAQYFLKQKNLSNTPGYIIIKDVSPLDLRKFLGDVLKSFRL